MLLVEDDPFSRGLVADTLRNAGFEVTAAHDAKSASAMFDRVDPDALVVDVNLGTGADGLELANALRSRAPYLAVLVLTRFPSPGVAGMTHRLPPHAAFLSKDGAPVMSFGVMGGHMQPQGHLQTMVRMLDYGQNPQTACDGPRWRVNGGLSLNVEPHMPAATKQGLADLGHQLDGLDDSYMDFGAGQFIWRLGDPAVDGYVAASDARRDGAAVAW